MRSVLPNEEKQGNSTRNNDPSSGIECMNRAIWNASKRPVASCCKPIFRSPIKRFAYAGIHAIENPSTRESSSRVLKPAIWKPVTFALGVSALAFAWSAEKTNYDTRRREETLSRIGRTKGLVGLAWGNITSSDDLNRSRLEDVRQRIVKVLQWSKNKSEELARATIIVGEGWISIPESKRTAYALLAGQAAVGLHLAF